MSGKHEITIGMNISEILNITPGPFEVHEISDPEWTERYIEVRTVNKAPIASFNGDNAVWLKGGIDECRANARLFASSPQVLESLIEITIEDDENFTPGTPLRGGIDNRIALIESATGKSWKEIKALVEVIR